MLRLCRLLLLWCVVVPPIGSGAAYAQDGVETIPPAAKLDSLPTTPTNAATISKTFGDIAERMQDNLSVPLTGNANQDFVTTMIAHQQASLDMARFLLDYGDDPELKALAQDIIRNQEREMNILRVWLSRNGG